MYVLKIAIEIYTENSLTGLKCNFFASHYKKHVSLVYQINKNISFDKNIVQILLFSRVNLAIGVIYSVLSE